MFKPVPELESVYLLRGCTKHPDKVYPVRPDDCPRLGVHLNLLEESCVLQLTEHSPAADDPLSEVEFRRRAISEGQLQTIVAHVPDSLNSRKHASRPIPEA